MEKTPISCAYYQQMLAVSELYRGNVPEAMTAFAKAIQAKPRALVFFFRAKHFLREGKNDEAAKDIAFMEKLIPDEIAAPNINYYEFLLALQPGENHDQLLKSGAQNFFTTRVAHLKQVLEYQRSLPAGILPVFAGLADARLKKIFYGMTLQELKNILGTPSRSYRVHKMSSGMAGLTAWCYSFPSEKIIVEFCGSETTGRIGDIRVFPSAAYHPQDGKRGGAAWFRPSNEPYCFGTVEAPR